MLNFKTLLHNFTSISIIYHVPKFQNDPSSVYWEFIQTDFGRKEKEVGEKDEEETEQNSSILLKH